MDLKTDHKKPRGRVIIGVKEEENWILGCRLDWWGGSLWAFGRPGCHEFRTPRRTGDEREDWGCRKEREVGQKSDKTNLA